MAAEPLRTGPEDDDEEVPAEFECSICMKLLLDPVTVSCGHTFCRLCLEKSLGYRGLCAVCRAPVAAGQGVNILIRSIVTERFPRALAGRQREAEEELRAVEQAADEARRHEAQGQVAATGGGPGAGAAAPVLPLIEGLELGTGLLPHCKAEVELHTPVEERLVEYALQGGRRFGVVDGGIANYDEGARPIGVCFEIEHIDRHGPRPRARLAGRFRFWLVEGLAPHEGGFSLGRCEAFFDEALPSTDLAAPSAGPGPAAAGAQAATEGQGGSNAEAAAAAPGPRATEVAIAALALLEAQLGHVGQGGRRIFGERHGDVPALPAGAAATSASLERLSFWLLGALITDEAERRHWLGSADTRARLEHCRNRLEAAGRRPVLNLPGASSWMSPGQSAFSSFALLIAIVALFAAKALGLLESGGLRFGGGDHEGTMQDAFAFGQLLR